MVTVSVHFEVEPELASQFESTWTNVFWPAIQVREGFVDCRLLKEWPRETDPVQRLLRYRLDITFQTEDLRMAWAKSPEHEIAYGQLQDVVLPTSSMRFRAVAKG